MTATPEKCHHILTDRICSEAQQVIALVRSNIQWPFLLDAKLGNHDNEPLSDAVIAEVHDIPFNSIGRWVVQISHALSQTDKQHGGPLAQTAQRANDVIARAAINNRHHRRPALYSETTIGALIKLGATTTQHSTLIRAAGYVSPPPAGSRRHDIDFIITDIAAHMARCHRHQTSVQILQSLQHRQDPLDIWPQLDLGLFIHRVANINPDHNGFYHPDQPWGNHISTKQLVANTMLRIFARDQQPRTIDYLAKETEQLVRNFLPDGYNTADAIRAAAYESDQVSWQGTSTFGLKTWESAINPRDMAGRRGRTGDLTYTFLMRHGPARTHEIIEHFRQANGTKRRTVQEALNHDPAHRFINLSSRRVAANPISQIINPDTPALTTVPDGREHRPPPVLYESELQWITYYVQALNELEAPFPNRVALTGARAAGFAQDAHPLEITIVVAPSDRPSLEHNLTRIAESTSQLVPSVQPNISLLSPQQWADLQETDNAEVYHNTWLGPHTDP